MKVILNDKSRLTHFEKLYVGECFIYHTNVYIKISPSYELGNAFNCKENCIVTVANNVLVEPINMQLMEVNEE